MVIIRNLISKLIQNFVQYGTNLAQLEAESDIRDGVISVPDLSGELGNRIYVESEQNSVNYRVVVWSFISVLSDSKI